VLDTLDSQHAVQLRAATLLRLSEYLQAPERGGRLMITVDGLTPLPTTELDDYLVVCKEFPDAGAALGRHLAWELGSDDATAVLSRAEAWIRERLRNQPAPGRMRDLAAALAVMVRGAAGCRWPSGTTSGTVASGDQRLRRPPLGSGTSPTISRLAVLGGYHGPLGGKRTALCYSPATSLTQMQQPHTRHERGGALSPPVRLAGRGSPSDPSDLAPTVGRP
jgi:hypothetical protein